MFCLKIKKYSKSIIVLILAVSSIISIMLLTDASKGAAASKERQPPPDSDGFFWQELHTQYIKLVMLIKDKQNESHEIIVEFKYDLVYDQNAENKISEADCFEEFKKIFESTPYEELDKADGFYAIIKECKAYIDDNNIPLTFDISSIQIAPDKLDKLDFNKVYELPIINMELIELRDQLNNEPYQYNY